MGGPIFIPTKSRGQQRRVQEKLELLLTRVDKCLVTRKQKLLLYKAGDCPRMNWELVTGDFPISWVSSTLEATVTRFLKRWSGLARPADTARLYLPRQEGGLGLPSIKLLYKRLRVSQSALLLTSRDPVTRQLASRLVMREEKL